MQSDHLRRLDELFPAHFERITRVIGRIVRDQARAEEIAVDVFLKWTRIPGRTGTERKVGFIERPLVRRSTNGRRQTRRKRFDRVFAAFLGRPQTPEQLHSADVRQRNARTVLGSIDSRMAGLLLWSEDVSYREMAAALDINPNYVGLAKPCSGCVPKGADSAGMDSESRPGPGPGWTRERPAGDWGSAILEGGVG